MRRFFVLFGDFYQNIKILKNYITRIQDAKLSLQCQMCDLIDFEFQGVRLQVS